MMKVSILFLHGGEIWEINFFIYQTSLFPYTNWPSVKEEESLTLISRIHDSKILETFQCITQKKYFF